MHSRARPKPSRRLQLSLLRRVFAGCCQSLLGDGPSRRYLRKSISGCLDPYPGGFLWCIYPLLPIETSAYSVRDGSAFPQYPVQRLRYGLSFRSCSHSFMFRPPDLFTTQAAPTAVTSRLGSRGFLHPSISRFVTSPCPGYASRPNRAIDDRGLSPLKTCGLVGRSVRLRSAL